MAGKQTQLPAEQVQHLYTEYTPPPPVAGNKYSILSKTLHMQPAKIYDISHTDIHKYLRLWEQGYPNAYKAKIKVHTKINCDELEKMLNAYHDKEVVLFCRYGWPSNRLPFAPWPVTSHKNHSSATEHPQYVDKYITEELAAGSTMGPFNDMPFHGRVGISPLSTREKKDGVSRRTIIDLSYPEGRSVNDYIDKDTFLGIQVQLQFSIVR